MGKLLGHVSVVVALGIVAFCCADSFGAPLVIDDFTAVSHAYYPPSELLDNPLHTVVNGSTALCPTPGQRPNSLTLPLLPDQGFPIFDA